MNARLPVNTFANPMPRVARSIVTDRRFALAAVSLVIALSGCATTSPAYHQYVMRGSVLSIDDKSLVVCVGERDGAKVGQVLEVVRHILVNAPKGPSTFRSQSIGRIRVTDLFDDHYAHAAITEGEPKVADVVELKSQ
ncbi:MAG: hypothetical protein ABI583_01195 [Betaproteobacteria bacterium]